MKKDRLDYRLAQAYMFSTREECLSIISEIEKDTKLKIKAKNSNGERLQEIEQMLEEETKKTRRSKNDIKKNNK